VFHSVLVPIDGSVRATCALAHVLRVDAECVAA